MPLAYVSDASLTSAHDSPLPHTTQVHLRKAVRPAFHGEPRPPRTQQHVQPTITRRWAHPRTSRLPQGGPDRPRHATTTRTRTAHHNATAHLRGGVRPAYPPGTSDQPPNQPHVQPTATRRGSPAWRTSRRLYPPQVTPDPPHATTRQPATTRAHLPSHPLSPRSPAPAPKRPRRLRRRRRPLPCLCGSDAPFIRSVETRAS